MTKRALSLIGLLILFTQSCNLIQDKGNLVTTVSEFNEAVSNASAGDVITLANGVWKDAGLLLCAGKRFAFERQGYGWR